VLLISRHMVSAGLKGLLVVVIVLSMGVLVFVLALDGLRESAVDHLSFIEDVFVTFIDSMLIVPNIVVLLLMKAHYLVLAVLVTLFKFKVFIRYAAAATRWKIFFIFVTLIE